MDIVFTYLAGLLSLINPCILLVPPIVLASALQASPLGPIALVGGMGFSFFTVGMAVVSFGQIVDANSDSVAQLGALVMVGFRMVILLPKFASGFAQLITGAAGHADNKLDQIDRHAIAGQIIGGLLLGVVWSPCIGPILGGAIASASQGKDRIWASLIMAIFALGVATVILTTGYGARNLILSHRGQMQILSRLAQPVLGSVFVLVGTTLYFKLHHPLEAWLLNALPD